MKICICCNKEFTDSYGKPRQRCAPCQSKFYNKTMDKNVFIKCPLCEEKFNMMINVTRHYKKCHNTEDLLSYKNYFIHGKFERNKCKCGCEKEIKFNKDYVMGHNSFGENNGFRGKKHTPETLEKLRIKQLKRWENPEYREQMEKMQNSQEYKTYMSELFKNKYKTGELTIWCKGLTKENNESLRKISEANKGENNYFFGKSLTGEQNYWFGKHLPDEAKEKIRQANIGKKYSEETKEKHRKNMLKRSPKAWISKIERVVVDYLKENNIELKHQKTIIDKYKVDIYIEKLNLIIEVYGCYWHCCNECNIPTISKEKQKSKNDYDEKRINEMKEAGYNILIIHEHNIHKSENYKQILEECISNYNNIL